MRKLALIALFAACLLLPASAFSTPNVSFANICLTSQSNSITPELVEKILRKVSQDHGYDFTCICAGYAKGTVTIGKDPIGYTVTIQEAGGSIATIQILDNL